MNKPINEQLKEIREERRMTLLDVSEMSGVDISVIHRWEKGQNLKTIERLNEVLKPMCAHIEIVRDIPLFYDSYRLATLAKTAVPSNYHELNFIKAYYKCRNDEEKQKVINQYLTRGSLEKESK